MSARKDDWDNVPGFNREKEEYINLDLEKWLKEHKIREEGSRLGVKNQPSTNSEKPDACEAKIVNWVNRRGRICRENVERHLTDLQNQLSDIDDEQELDALKQKVVEIENNAVRELQHQAQDSHNIWPKHKDDVREARQDYLSFKQKNELTRPPDYSHRNGVIMFILCCFIIETALNATLLMEVNVFGFLGSVAQMGLISAVNILILALAVGALLRQRNSVSVWKSLIAWLGIILLVSIDSLFNMLIGHYRDSMQAVLSNASVDVYSLGKDTMQRMLENPSGLEAFQSVLLALLGFLFFALASWKWYQRDDPYPDYGRRHRQLKEIEDQYIEVYKQTQENLKKVFSDYQSRLEDKRHALEIKKTKLREISKRGHELVKSYPIHLHQYQHDLNELLEAYRSANRETRTDAPPAYFSARVLVDEEIFQPPAFDPPVATNIAGVTDRVHEAITRVQKQYDDVSREAPTLEAITG